MRMLNKLGENAWRVSVLDHKEALAVKETGVGQDIRG